jgi:hypothetical protein
MLDPALFIRNVKYERKAPSLGTQLRRFLLDFQETVKILAARGGTQQLVNLVARFMNSSRRMLVSR